MTKSPYLAAALFIALSGLAHLAAPGVGGTQALWLMPIGVLYLGLTAGLNRNMRWLAYCTFFVAAIGGIVALSQIWALGPVPGWWWAVIMAADWLAAAALFVALWRPAPSEAPDQ